MALIAQWLAADAVETDDDDAAIVALAEWATPEGFAIAQATAASRPTTGVDARGIPIVQFSGGQSLSGLLPRAVAEAAATQLSVVIVAAFDAPATPRTVLRLDNDVDPNPFFEMNTIALALRAT